MFERLIMKKATIVLAVFIAFTSCRKEDVYPPEIRIINPDNNAMVSENDTLVLQAMASDDNDIAYVSFIVDGLPFYDFNKPYTCDLKDTISLGQHSFFVYASDVYGNISDRAEASFTVFSDHSPYAYFYVDERIMQAGEEFVFYTDSCNDEETIFENLLFRWDWDGDNIWDTEKSTGSSFYHIYDEMGEYFVKLEVTDEHDNVALYSKRLVCRGTFTDPRDNKNYLTVKIGVQVWMAENLAYETESGSICYENDPVNCETYGMLYEYNAALTACPEGWRLPLDEDWLMLELYAGMDSSDLENSSERLSGSIGLKLKSRQGWEDDGNGTDEFGFSIIPGGNFSKPYFYWIGTAALFWSAGDRMHNTYPVYVRQFRSDTEGNYRQFSRERTGSLSVRCIKEL